jgi:hypothetical protein
MNVTLENAFRVRIDEVLLSLEASRVWSKVSVTDDYLAITLGFGRSNNTKRISFLEIQQSLVDIVEIEVTNMVGELEHDFHSQENREEVSQTS